MTPGRLVYPKYAAALDHVRRRQIFKVSSRGMIVIAQILRRARLPHHLA
jgi:hypothetical protein